MKARIFITAIVAVIALGTSTVSAQKKANSETVTFCVPMDCEGCRTKIINYMSYEKGVKALDVNLEAQTATVTFNPKRTNPEALISAFAKLDKEATVKGTDNCYQHNHSSNGHNHNH